MLERHRSFSRSTPAEGVVVERNEKGNVGGNTLTRGWAHLRLSFRKERRSTPSSSSSSTKPVHLLCDLEAVAVFLLLQKESGDSEYDDKFVVKEMVLHLMCPHSWYQSGSEVSTGMSTVIATWRRWLGVQE